MIVALVAGFLAIQLIFTWARLRHVPGPLPAKFTNMQRLLWVRTRRAHEIHHDLHRRFGKLVRMGPNMISVSDPDAIPIIYGFDGKFKKSDLYSVFPAYQRTKVQMGMVSQQDESVHKVLRRPFASVYSVRSLESLEPLVSDAVDTLLLRLSEQSVADKDVDLGLWLQFFVWDALCSTMFSKRLGFLDRGFDIDDMLKLLWKHFQKAAPISQMPWFDHVWSRNPVLLYFKPSHRSTPTVTLAVEQIKDREQKWREKPTSEASQTDDILGRFIKTRANEPGAPDWALLAWTLGGLGAGGDTSVNVVHALFYNLLSCPESARKVSGEIQATTTKLSQGTWKEARSFPYLDACIKEAARICPSIGLPLERIVPPGGTIVAGTSIPAGTVVGISAWVVNRNKDIFGKDADCWRPERWLCDKAQRTRMEQTMLSFGAGHRVCPGQNLFNLIVLKLVVAFFKTFKAQLARPNDPLNIENSWLMRQKGFIAKLQPVDEVMTNK